MTIVQLGLLRNNTLDRTRTIPHILVGTKGGWSTVTMGE